MGDKTHNWPHKNNSEEDAPIYPLNAGVHIDVKHIFTECHLYDTDRKQSTLSASLNHDQNPTMHTTINVIVSDGLLNNMYNVLKLHAFLAPKLSIEYNIWYLPL